MSGLLHIISHTDLDGITAAAVAWHANRTSRWPIKVTLCGYGTWTPWSPTGSTRGRT